VSRTTNQGNDMASFNDETSVEDEALTDCEEEGVRDTPIEFHNMVNLCESNRCLVTITKRMQNQAQVMVGCGNLASTAYDRRHHQDDRQKPSLRAAARWYQSVPGQRKVNAGRMNELCSLLPPTTLLVPAKRRIFGRLQRPFSRDRRRSHR
jgi:hypothetical protein